MPTFVCNTCNAEFLDDKDQKSHYRSDWHQYNLKRKLAGAHGVSEALFILRLETLAAEKRRLDAEHLLYTCSVCNKEYRSSKAHAQHLRSKLHIQRASLWSKSSSDPITVTRPAPCRPVEVNHGEEASRNATFQHEEIDAHCGSQFQVNGYSSDEWEEVNDDDDVVSLDSCELDALDECQGVESGIHVENWDANQCFFCNIVPDGTVGGCVEHMHKQHGFFIPDAEYLKDPQGLLNYLGMKVTKDLMCLYCEDRGKQFSSLEAVRKHMVSKSHCKLRYGDEGQEEELENFYDFTSSYLPEEDAQLVSIEEPTAVPVLLSAGGAELIIKHDSGKKQCAKTIGSREFLRYYKQKPRPSDMHDGALVNALVTRYRTMGLSTKQSQVTQKAPHFQADAMGIKLGMKSNVLKNLPRNVPY
eukprot:c14259_g1_i1 orf=498-1742(-)